MPPLFSKTARVLTRAGFWAHTLTAMSPTVELPRLRGLSSTTPAFRAELVRMADRLGLQVEPIAAIMSMESGFNPQAENPDSHAVGLIQFIPPTAKLLGTTTDALRDMSALEQLPFVERFFRVGPLRPSSPVGDYYVATFVPGFVGKSDDTVIAVAETARYDQNKGLDRNHDGSITVREVRAVLEDVLSGASSEPPILVDMSVPPIEASRSKTDWAPILLMVGTVIALNWKEVKTWIRTSSVLR
jgi:hypothetical protein